MMSSLGRLAAAIGVAFSVTKLIQFGSSAIEVASDIAEVENVVSKSFGSMRGEMDALADTAIESLGMSRLTAYQTGSSFMSMGKSMLDSMTVAKDMALDLTRISGNMASFFNTSSDVAATALKSIYTGETETLKQFGVVMTEANLQNYAMNQGIKEKISAMSQSEKVMLRYAYVTEQLSYIGDDFVDTQASWANQTRILTERWTELKSVIGTGLITALTPVLQVINTILQRLIDMANTAGKVFSQLFGIKAQSFTATTEATQELSSGLDGVAGSADKAAKSIGALAKFDDLNVLQQDTSATGASGIGGSTSGITDTPLNEELDKTESLIGRIENLKKAFKEGWEVGFKTTKLNEVKKHIAEIKKNLDDIFSNNQVLQSAKNLEEQLANTLGKIVGSAASVSISIADGLTGGIGQALKDPVLKSFSSEKISGILDNMTSLAKVAGDVADACSEVGIAFESQGFKDIVEYFAKLGTFIDLTILDAITGFLGDVADFITSPFVDNASLIAENLELIFEIVGDLLQPATDLIDLLMESSGKYQDSAFHSFMKDLTGKASEGIGDMLQRWNELLTYISEITGSLDFINVFDMEEVSKALNDWFENDVKPIFTIEHWTEQVKNITESLSKALDDYEELWSERIPSWWEEDVEPWFTLEKWKETFSTIGKSLSEEISDTKEKWKEEISDWWEKDVAPWFTVERWSDELEGIGRSLAITLEKFIIVWNVSIKSWWREEVKPWFTLEKWKEIFKSIPRAIAENVSGMRQKWGERIKAWWEEDVKPWFTAKKWKEAGISLKDGIVSGFRGIKDSFREIINGLLESMEDGLSGACRAINKIIKGYNSVADISPVLPSIKEINLPKLPRLATGNVFQGGHPYAAIVNDQPAGQINVESPLSTIQEALQNVMDNQKGYAGGNVQIILDGQMVGTLLFPYLQQEYSRIGTSLLLT